MKTVRGLANDLSWRKERSASALANYVPHMQKEGERITSLRAGRVVSSPGDDASITSMCEEEESRFSDTPSMGQSMDTDCEADVDASGQKSPEQGGETSPHLD